MDNKKLNLITELAQRLPVDGTKLTRKDVAYILTESQWKMCYKWLSEEAADYITADRSQLSVKDAKTKRALIAYLESVREAKTNKAIYRIRDVAAMLDVPISTLRFWEDTFPQFKPDRTTKGQRRYAPNDIEVAKLIKSLLRDKGYSLDFAKRRMNEIHGNYSYEVSCKSTEDAINLLREVAKMTDNEYAIARIEAVENWITGIGIMETPQMPKHKNTRGKEYYKRCIEEAKTQS